MKTANWGCSFQHCILFTVKRQEDTFTQIHSCRIVAIQVVPAFELHKEIEVRFSSKNQN